VTEESPLRINSAKNPTWLRIKLRDRRILPAIRRSFPFTAFRVRMTGEVSRTGKG
jgi:hypothetical protein